MNKIITRDRLKAAFVKANTFPRGKTISSNNVARQQHFRAKLMDLQEQHKISGLKKSAILLSSGIVDTYDLDIPLCLIEGDRERLRQSRPSVAHAFEDPVQFYCLTNGHLPPI